MSALQRDGLGSALTEGDGNLLLELIVIEFSGEGQCRLEAVYVDLASTALA